MGKNVKVAFLVSVCMLVLLGCGHKTAPVVPRTLVPRPVKVLQVRVRPEGVYVVFGTPTKYVKKGKIHVGVVYVVDRCLGRHCTKVAQHRVEPGEKVIVFDPDAQEGMFYRYSIRVKAEAKGVPVDLPVTVGPFPPPPLQVKAESFQSKVVVVWSNEGEGPFYLYRRFQGGRYRLKPLAVVMGNRYEDFMVENGTTYYYVVRRARTKGKLIVESKASDEVGATPKDTYPPPTPVGFTVHYRGEAVYLAWDPVVVPDLAGYYVYRKELGGEWTLLMREALSNCIYVDHDLRKGLSYFYKVSAVDKSGNISMPSEVVKISIPNH